MNTASRVSLAVLATLMTCVASVTFAQVVTPDSHKANVRVIEAAYKTARAACDALNDNAKDICIADAQGREKIALAEAQLAFEPNQKARYNVSFAKAEAAYAVANEKCDDKSGNLKDVCIKEAKAAQVAAKADALTLLKTAQANADAKETSAQARVDADKKVAVARKDAAADKRDAEYAVAIEKCNAQPAGTRDACISKAKTRFGKF